MEALFLLVIPAIGGFASGFLLKWWIGILLATPLYVWVYYDRDKEIGALISICCAWSYTVAYVLAQVVWAIRHFDSWWPAVQSLPIWR